MTQHIEFVTIRAQLVAKLRTSQAKTKEMNFQLMRPMDKLMERNLLFSPKLSKVLEISAHRTYLVRSVAHETRVLSLGWIVDKFAHAT